MAKCFIAWFYFFFFVRLPFHIIRYRTLWLRKGPLYGIVRYEEEGCAGRGANDCASHPPVYAIEASAGGETRAGL
jgi:hypothetical protein